MYSPSSPRCRVARRGTDTPPLRDAAWGPRASLPAPGVRGLMDLSLHETWRSLATSYLHPAPPPSSTLQMALTLALALALAGSAAAEQCDVCHLSGYFHKVRPAPAPAPPPDGEVAPEGLTRRVRPRRVAVVGHPDGVRARRRVRAVRRRGVLHGQDGQPVSPRAVAPAPCVGAGARRPGREGGLDGRVPSPFTASFSPSSSRLTPRRLAKERSSSSSSCSGFSSLRRSHAACDARPRDTDARSDEH